MAHKDLRGLFNYGILLVPGIEGETYSVAHLEGTGVDPDLEGGDKKIIPSLTGFKTYEEAAAVLNTARAEGRLK